MVPRERLEEDREIIRKFMKNYDEEWRKLGEDYDEIKERSKIHSKKEE